MKLIIIIAILLISFQGNSQEVIDGDTFRYKGKLIRLAFLDCPELFQPYGMEAKIFTEKMIKDKDLRILNIGLDMYYRDVCNVYVGNIWLNQMIVEKGYAWAYKKYSPLYDKQQIAKKAKIGMWINENNEPPFIYRNKQKI